MKSDKLRRAKTERQKDRKTERQKDRKTERQKDRKTERYCLFFPFKRAFIAFMVVLMMEANHFWDNPWHRSLELPRSSYFSLTLRLHHHPPSKVFLRPFVSQRNAKVPKSCKTALHRQSCGVPETNEASDIWDQEVQKRLEHGRVFGCKGDSD